MRRQGTKPRRLVDEGAGIHDVSRRKRTRLKSTMIG
jgi:hypothetical protein